MAGMEKKFGECAEARESAEQSAAVYQVRRAAVSP